MFLTKRKDGSFIPSSNSDHESAKKIPFGSEVKASISRNAKFHRKAFALLNLGHENQDLIPSFEIYRKIKTKEAGYFDRAVDKYGVVHELPRSLSFDTMSAETFEKWYNDTLEVISRDMQTAPEDIRNELDGFY